MSKFYVFDLNGVLFTKDTDERIYLNNPDHECSEKQLYAYLCHLRDFLCGVGASVLFCGANRHSAKPADSLSRERSLESAALDRTCLVEKKEKLSGKERGRTGIVPWIVKAMLVPALLKRVFRISRTGYETPSSFSRKGDWLMIGLGWRAIFQYSDGAMPTMRLNCLSKVTRLLKPACMAR